MVPATKTENGKINSEIAIATLIPCSLIIIKKFAMQGMKRVIVIMLTTI
jgi:hypothetical protein